MTSRCSVKNVLHGRSGEAERVLGGIQETEDAGTEKYQGFIEIIDQKGFCFCTSIN